MKILRTVGDFKVFKDFKDFNAASRKNIQASLLLCARFALSLYKIGCISAKHTSKLVVMRSICTIFADRLIKA